MATNAWLKYRDDALVLKEPKKDIWSLFDFKFEVAYGLKKCGTSLKQGGGRRSELQKELDRRAQKKSTTLLPTMDIRLDNTGH